MGEPDLYDAVVIGAGFAGPVAARDLIEAGHRVLVLEARDRAGGRTHSSTFPGTDVVIDLGAEWFDRSATTSWQPRWSVMEPASSRPTRRVPTAGTSTPGTLRARARRPHRHGRTGRGPRPDQGRHRTGGVLERLRSGQHRCVGHPVQRVPRQPDAPPAIADLLRAQSYTLTGALPTEFSAFVHSARSRASTTIPRTRSFASLARVDIGSGRRNASPTRSRPTSAWGEPVTAVTETVDGMEVLTATGNRFAARQCVLASAEHAGRHRVHAGLPARARQAGRGGPHRPVREGLGGWPT